MRLEGLILIDVSDVMRPAAKGIMGIGMRI